MRKLFLVAAAALSVSLTTPVSSRDATPLTTMDYVLLRQLVARHAWALDSGADNGYAFADLFTPDGVFRHPDAKGRDQLAALARGGRRGPMFVHSFAMNHVIEPSPEGAVGTQYVIAIDIDDNGQPGRGASAAGPAR